MELRHLRYFVAVAEEGNFHRAALRLHVAQPALSRQVRALEEELGVQLFERNARGVRLTAAGSALLTDATAILADIDLARQNVRRIAAGATGYLRIGVNEIALTDPAVIEAIRRLRSEQPGIGVELAPMPSSAQTAAILTDRLDAGFLYVLPQAQPLAALHVRDYTLLLGLPEGHRLAAKPRIEAQDVMGEPFIWTAAGALSFVHDELLRSLRARGVEIDIVQHASGTETTLSMIAAGIGLGFVHSSAVDRPHRGVALREMEDLRPSLPLSFAWRRERTSPALDSLLQALRATLDETAG